MYLSISRNLIDKLRISESENLLMMMIRLNVIFRAVIIIVRLLGQKSEVATIITMKIIIILLLKLFVLAYS